MGIIDAPTRDEAAFPKAARRRHRHGRHRIGSLPPQDPLGKPGHQPHSLHGLHRGRPASPGAGALLLSQPLELRRPRGRDSGGRRLQAHGGGRALGDHGARRRRLDQRGRERVRPSRHAVLPRAPRQPQGRRLHLPLSPVELHARRRPAGRALPPWREAGRQGQRRHAGRLQARRARPQQAEGGKARRRGLRGLRSRHRIARRLHGPGDPGLLRPALQRPQAHHPRLQPPAHSGQLEAHAGEHQGPVPPGPAAHLVRDLRPLARGQQVGVEDGPAPPARRHDLHARRQRQGRAGDTGVELQGKHEAQRRASSTSCPSPGGAARRR